MKYVFVLIFCVFLTACKGSTEADAVVDNEIDVAHSAEIVPTGEYFTAEQMEILKSEAVSCKTARTGIGGFANIVVIEPANGGNDEVYISIVQYLGNADSPYEKMRIDCSDGERAYLIYAAGGAGSGELTLAFRIASEGSERIEIFMGHAFSEAENGPWHWQNETEQQIYFHEWLNEIPFGEGIFY